MISLIDSNTVALLTRGLDATVMRHQAIAHNIANANTPGFKPVGLSFEDYMADARHALSLGGSTRGNLHPVFEPPTIAETGDEAVSLDVEVARLSENTLRHQMLLKALSRHFSIIGTAVSEGKR